MLLRAEYRDGFTEHLLRWELIAQAGTVLVRAEWFAHGEPDDTAHSEFRFSLDDQQIQRIFETLDPLEEKYDAGCDDVESSEFCVERDRTIRRQVHGGFQLRRRVCGGFILGGELPGIDAFFSVWDPIQREVESRLQLPGSRRRSRSTLAMAYERLAMDMHRAAISGLATKTGDSR